MTALTPFPVPLLGFAAFSGTGKTTLIEQLIPMLIEQGLRIALVKHSHHDIEMDKPGKDSYRLRKAGASQVVLAGTHRSICFHEHTEAHDSDLNEQLALLNTACVDLVLVEGYRDQAFPKIELHRSALGKPFLYPNDTHIIALVCDQYVETDKLPLFEFTQLQQLVTFILKRIVSPT
jgi:molybdopterin-guanine dinucleotide biosynthesis protein MobB